MFNQKLTDRLILASASPRRREMLSAIGLRFEIEATDIDETVLPHEAPELMVKRLALAKAQAVAIKDPRAWVVGADTTVVIDQIILGKPADAAEAASMLKMLSAREHQVLSAFSIVNHDRGITHSETHLSKVKMVSMSDTLIADYIATGEPLDKAGGYAIQGLGAALVESIEGSYTNIVGLNLNALIAALRKLGWIE